LKAGPNGAGLRYLNLTTNNIKNMKTSRRSFIAKSVLTAAGVTGGLHLISRASATGLDSLKAEAVSGAGDPDAFKISIFSKHLQWLDYKEMAKAVREIGFDGVDLTVRPQGHVLPERVEEDLPKAVEAVSKEGKKVYMLTTSIDNADDPLTEKILKTASSLGIGHYRMGWGHYDEAKSVEDNISANQARLAKLAKLNEKYNVSGEYQNHSGIAREGIYFGAAIWDLALVLNSLNSPWIGSQYDIYHSTIEGANTWPIGLKLISPFIRSIDIKDFFWLKKEGKWISETVPLGEGMVDFNKYFGLIKKLGLNVPVSLHYEYPLGGAENGADKITMKREDVLAAMSRDLKTLKGYMKVAGLG
jgi:L-ribulose-5-phosphate 3-epimerase